jgi:heme oxygenase
MKMLLSQVKRIHYIQFLVDSLRVYETFEEIVKTTPTLTAFRTTGLERAAALRKDIAYLSDWDAELNPPPVCGPAGQAYSEFLQRTASESVPRFMCHYYNQYFAHTAGGRMIGKRMSDSLLEGRSLAFYEWEGDVKVCSTLLHLS